MAEEENGEKESPKLLNTSQAARHLGVTKAAITRLREEGRLPGVPGSWGRWYYTPEAVAAVVMDAPTTDSSLTESTAEETPPTSRERLISIFNEMGFPPQQQDTADEDASNQAPLVRMANAILVDAIDLGSSDIHIEPDSRNLRVRCRIDGILHESMKIPNHIKGPLIQRYKIMADINVLERRVPQAGSMPIRHNNVDFDVRVSTLPSAYGENVTMHILHRSDLLLGLKKLGMVPEVQFAIENLLDYCPSGLILVAGPNGSGITTTAYNLLSKFNSIEQKIVTLEPLPEYTLSGLTQSYYGGRFKVSLSETLRLLPLMDVDTLFLGDINTAEAMAGAIEVSISGTCVLATMAATDASMALWRLSQMGLFTEKKPERAQMQPRLQSYQYYPEKTGLPVQQILKGILAQQLVRRICAECKEPYTVPAFALSEFGFVTDDQNEELTLFRGKGCDACRGSGYKGRIGIYELMVMNWEIAALVALRAPLADIRDAAEANGLRPLRDDALARILSGETTPEEVTRVLGRRNNDR